MRIVAIAIILASSVCAQRNTVSPSGFGRVMFPGGGPTGAYGGATSPNVFGNVLFPGTGAPAAIRPIPGNPIYGVPTPPIVQHGGHGSSTVVPYPVFVGGGYYNYGPPLAGGYISMGQAWPTPGQPGFSGVNYAQPVYATTVGQQVEQPQQEPSPVVIINQYFRPDAAPITQTASAPSATSAVAPQPETQAAAMSTEMQTIFLIAMKDHTIYAANSYWVEENMLSYITVQGTENSVSMDLVDRDLSRRLNKDRKVAFGLPNN
jgi:hypothetical protein